MHGYVDGGRAAAALGGGRQWRPAPRSSGVANERLDWAMLGVLTNAGGHDDALHQLRSRGPRRCPSPCADGVGDLEHAELVGDGDVHVGPADVGGLERVRRLADRDQGVRVEDVAVDGDRCPRPVRCSGRSAITPRKLVAVRNDTGWVTSVPATSAASRPQHVQVPSAAGSRRRWHGRRRDEGVVERRSGPSGPCADAVTPGHRRARAADERLDQDVRSEPGSVDVDRHPLVRSTSARR